MADPIDPRITPPPSGIADDVHEKARVLTRHIEEGKSTVPDAPQPLICKPQQIESWRVFKIMSEFVEGFDVIGKYGLAATFFGSERTAQGAPYYEAARALAASLAKQGFAIITGGAQGIMEAANQGAFEAGGQSVGLNIRLAANQQLNTYLTESAWFDHFFVRKVMLTFSSDVYIYFPGGFGTLDEFFEIVTLVQTAKIKKIPIILYGKEYWDPIISLFKDHLMTKFQTISPSDMELFVVVDTPEDALAHVMGHVSC